jgi:hypothetical protein
MCLLYDRVYRSQSLTILLYVYTVGARAVPILLYVYTVGARAVTILLYIGARAVTILLYIGARAVTKRLPWAGAASNLNTFATLIIWVPVQDIISEFVVECHFGKKGCAL